jgi:general secretion pathway protein H
MRILEVGNKPWRKGQGFTLVELMVVITLVAIASTGAILALRSGPSTELEREGTRLAGLLDMARARSRLTGQPVRWIATARGFEFSGIPAGTFPENWLYSGTTAAQGSTVALGPEPVIGAQSVRITSGDARGLFVIVATDGLRPFSLRAEP